MDLLKPLVRGLTYDLYLRHDGYDLGAYRTELRMSQFLTRGDIEAMQLARLKEILEGAFRANSFYRDKLRSCGFQPGELRSLEDLKHLPILTKDDIRNRLCSELSDGFDYSNTIHKRTGGSTGVPVHVYMDHAAASAKKAAAERHDEWAGRVAGDRVAAVWGDTDTRMPLKEWLRNELTGRVFYLDTLRFDARHLNDFIAKIRRFKPPVLLGHAHSVYRLAEYVRDLGATDITFRSVITTAMVLPERERETIETTFRASVFDRYGCEELSIIASECEAHAGLHICSELLVLEINDDDPRKPGRILITDLMNRAMPLIRYEIGDSGLLADGDCPCGRGLPRLAKVYGRTADFLYSTDGTPVFGISILDTFMIHIPGCKQMQIVQDARDHLEIRVVRDEAFSDESRALLGRHVGEVFGPPMRYTLQFVDQIEMTERGKYRFSICRIEPPDRVVR